MGLLCLLDWIGITLIYRLRLQLPARWRARQIERAIKRSWAAHRAQTGDEIRRLPESGTRPHGGQPRRNLSAPPVSR